MLRVFFIVMSLAGISATTTAQDKFPDLNKGAFGFSPALELSDSPTADVAAQLVQLDAQTVELQVTVTPPNGFYIYSMKTSGGYRTKILLDETAGLQPAQQGFTPDHPPKREYSEDFGTDVEKFPGTVTWSQQLRSSTPLRGTIRVQGKLKGQICSTGPGGTCVLLSPAPEFTAELEADESQPMPTRPEQSPADSESSVTKTIVQEGVSADAAKLRYIVTLSPASPHVGDEVLLSIRADIRDGWHTYSNTLSEDVRGASPTRIELSRIVGLVSIDDEFSATPPAELMENSLGDMLEVHEHSVTWSLSCDGAGDSGVRRDQRTDLR